LREQARQESNLQPPVLERDRSNAGIAAFVDFQGLSSEPTTPALVREPFTSWVTLCHQLIGKTLPFWLSLGRREECEQARQLAWAIAWRSSFTTDLTPK
jgi:hypothetical protein